MTDLRSYQEEAKHFRRAARALRLAAKEPGKADASSGQQEAARLIALNNLKKIGAKHDQTSGH